MGRVSILRLQVGKGVRIIAVAEAGIVVTALVAVFAQDFGRAFGNGWDRLSGTGQVADSRSDDCAAAPPLESAAVKSTEKTTTDNVPIFWWRSFFWKDMFSPWRFESLLFHCDYT